MFLLIIIRRVSLIPVTIVMTLHQLSALYVRFWSMIEPTSLAPSPKSIQLVLSPAHNISIDLGQGESTAHVMSNNSIQLKFRTKEFVGEFFHYTGDLFLIYKSGHLARLTCTRS